MRDKISIRHYWHQCFRDHQQSNYNYIPNGYLKYLVVNSVAHANETAGNRITKQLCHSEHWVEYFLDRAHCTAQTLVPPIAGVAPTIYFDIAQLFHNDSRTLPNDTEMSTSRFKVGFHREYSIHFVLNRNCFMNEFCMM